jgi:putative transposase
MTQALVRYQNSGDFHFITFSCYQRQPYLGNPEARTLFERSLETMRRRYNFYLFGYVLMPEHVHLLGGWPSSEIEEMRVPHISLLRCGFPQQRPAQIRTETLGD